MYFHCINFLFIILPFHRTYVSVVLLTFVFLNCRPIVQTLLLLLILLLVTVQISSDHNIGAFARFDKILCCIAFQISLYFANSSKICKTHIGHYTVAIKDGERKAKVGGLAGRGARAYWSQRMTPRTSGVQRQTAPGKRFRDAP